MARRGPRGNRAHIKPPKNPPTNQRSQDFSSDEQDFRNFTIAVSIEWDGQPPRMTWYDRLHRKGIRVRGGNEKEFSSPLARRQSLDTHGHRNGVVFQEGFYLVRNQDIAKELAFEAEKFGARSVLIGHIFMDRFSVGEQDIEVLESYFLKSSKRGRKPVEEAGRYTVTCFDELLTYETELSAVPWACPTCNSRAFHARSGKAKVLLAPKWSKVGDLWDYWLRSRFDAQGIFEIPQYEEGGGMLLPDAPTVTLDEPVVDLPSKLKVTPDLQMKIWDTCYALSPTVRPEDSRIEMRLRVLGAYWNAGGTNTDYVLTTPDEGYDIVDMCTLLRDEFARYL